MKISIIIPCYNSSQYFERLRKTLSCYVDDSEIEVIFVDDKYSENESVLLKDYVYSYNSCSMSAIYLENDKNLGASVSRKRGVEIAKGEYIAFLDSDDAWCKDKIYTQLSLMENEKADISGGGTMCIQESEYSDIFEQVKSMNEYNYVTIYDFLIRNYFSTPAVMVKKEIILNNNFSEELRYSEDYECWRRILLNGKGLYIHSVGTYSFKHPYISNSGSLSSNVFKMSLSEIKGFILMYKQQNLSYRLKLMIPLAILYSILKSIRRLLLSAYYKR